MRVCVWVCLWTQAAHVDISFRVYNGILIPLWYEVSAEMLKQQYLSFQFHMCQLHIFYIGWRLHIHCQGCCPETSWTQQNTEKLRKYCQCLCRALRHRAHTKQLWMLHCQEPQEEKQAKSPPAKQTAVKSCLGHKGLFVAPSSISHPVYSLVFD